MLTPLKAIRAKCLDCCCGSGYEVRLCPITDCSLHPYRFGKNPNRAGITHSGSFSPNINGSIAHLASEDSFEGKYTPESKNKKNAN